MLKKYALPLELGQVPIPSSLVLSLGRMLTEPTKLLLRFSVLPEPESVIYVVILLNVKLV